MRSGRIKGNGNRANQSTRPGFCFCASLSTNVLSCLIPFRRGQH